MDLFLGIKKYLFHFLRFNFKRIHYFVLCLLTSQFQAWPLTLKLVLGKGFGLCLDSFLCWPLFFWVGPCGGGRVWKGRSKSPSVYDRLSHAVLLWSSFGSSEASRGPSVKQMSKATGVTLPKYMHGQALLKWSAADSPQWKSWGPLSRAGGVKDEGFGRSKG